MPKNLNNPDEIPVYLFTGFLESGKTKFIQETLEDARFNSGEETLVLLCEEGEEELDPATFASQNVFVETLSEEDALTSDRLSARLRRHGAKRVLIEYNGMWQLGSLYDALPETWMVYQQVCFFDASTVEVYNANLRSLVVDKVQNADLVVFNRVKQDADVMPYHKLVRSLSRQTAILYEAEDGSVRQDEIEDPLPFDIEAPVIVIEDKDYAYFMRDLIEEFEKYDGKTVRFTGVVAKDQKLPKKSIVIGRHVMTCCADDIAYNGLACVTDAAADFVSHDWATVEAKIKVENHRIYRSKGPVLYATFIEKREPLPPDQRVATYY